MYPFFGTRFSTLTCILLIGGLIGLASAPPASAQSLFEDPRASQVGDVVTVILAEEATAQRGSGYQDESSSQLGASAGSSTLDNTFGADAQFSSSSETANETFQNELLEGRITAEVVDIDELGNLVIEGERRVDINGVTHVMNVRGTVRAIDVRSDNSLLSYQVANADIEYRRSGITRNLFSPSFFAQIGSVAALAAAIFFGTQ